MSASAEPVMALRGNTGLFVYRGFKDKKTLLQRDGAQTRVMAFSQDGRYFAFCDSKNTVVCNAQTGSELFSLPQPRVAAFYFSPKQNFLCTWQPYVIYGTNSDGRMPDPNLNVYSLPAGNKVITWIAKQSTNWQPQWTDDEKLWCRLSGSEILIHEGAVQPEGENKYTNKIVIPHLSHFSVSAGQAPHHLAAWVPAHKGQNARVFLYAIDGKPVSNKTLMRADAVKFHWNSKGTAVLVVASTDVDQTGKSYYGEQHLYLLMTNGESYRVTLDKQGPVYSIAWAPNGQSFSVVYGYMPAAACQFNLKGEVVLHMGSGPRNEVHYNAFGNILLLTGFGNLAGNMEFYSPKDSKLILKMAVPDTTLFQWAPDGRHFVTATTTPRLRQDNNYRVWSYHGQLITDVHFEKGEELWEVLLSPAGGSAPFAIEYPDKATAARAGLRPSHAHPVDAGLAAKGAITSSGSYVPPHLRKGNKGAPVTPTSSSAPPAAKPQLTEHQKKVRNIENKLKQIQQLKARQESGQKLENNQLEKMTKEAELLQQLEELKLSDEQ